MNRRVTIFKERAENASAKALGVAEKASAENRTMTAAERNIYEDSMAELASCLDGVKAARAEESQMAGMVREFAGIGGPIGTTDGRKDSGRRLSFKGNMAATVAARMLGGHQGEKALAPSGAAVVPQGFTADPVALGRVATGLLDVLPTRVQTSASYAYLAQVTRTNNAAVVSDGDVKPTSVIGLTRVEQTLAVIATLSEQINRFWILDNTSLEQWIDGELSYNLGTAVEAKVLADVNATSGIQEQLFSTSALETIRKSITKLEVAGHAAGAIVLHPSDWETVELALSSTNAVEHLALPYDPATRRLFGVPVATTVSASAGTGHVIAQGAVVVDTDSTGVSVQWSENVGDSFSRNGVVARCETRIGTSVLAPLGVVVATVAD